MDLKRTGMKMKVTKPKPIHPWNKGSVSPVQYGPGKRDEDHEACDKPTPIRELAENHGVRWYRDACGDDHIPGKFGEIFRYGIGKLGVQIGGPRANNTKTQIPEGSNKYINAIIRRYHWPVSQCGAGEIVFIVPENSINDALKAIRAYRKPKGGNLPNTSESRERGRRALQLWREQTGK
jgi:hypothetical protein